MAEKKNFEKRMDLIRQKNIESRAGKKLIYTENQMLDFIRNGKVNTQMQHCIIKVMDKVDGTDKEKFLSAFNICGAVFSRNGYQDAISMTMSGKGMKNNFRHRKELNAGIKSAKYRSLENKLWSNSLKQNKIDKKDEDAK